MNIASIAGQLSPVKNSIIINQSLFNGIFKEVLTQDLQIEEFQINKAKLITDDSLHVKVTGVCDFLNCKDLAVTAWFYTDDSGVVVGKIKIDLIGEERQSNSWKFSRSFEALPGVINYGDEITIDSIKNPTSVTAKSSFLDSLFLYNSAFVICTNDLIKDEDGYEYLKGLNFCSKLRPNGTLGIFEKELQNATEVNIYGHINIPLGEKNIEKLAPLDNLWKHPEIPGIHLTVDLEVNKKWGKLSLSQTQFKIYSPLTQDFTDNNPDYPANQAYSTKLSVPSANIEIDMWADVHWNLPQALFIAECQGINVSNLAALADIGGGKTLDTQLPKSLKPLIKGLDKLELERFSIALDLYNNRPELSMASFTIGMPNLNWHVWKDHFVMEEIAVRFEVDNPMAKRPAKPSFEVDVMGTMDVQKVPVSVYASSKNNFTLYAQLEKEQTLPLKGLIKKYAPALPAPSDLTIDKMSVTVAPGHFYGFSTILASEPKPWIIPLGPKKLRVSDVHMNITVPTKGATTGSVGGVLEFSNDVQFTIAYDLPGDVQIRGVFPKSSLSHLIKTLSNQELTLPKGFDIEFDYAFVMMKKQGSNYLFSLATEIEGLGILAFETRKDNNGWGFATGIELEQGSPSSLPGLKVINKIEKAFHLKKFTLVASSFDSPSFAFPDMAQFQTPVLATKKVNLPSHTSGVIAGVNLFSQWQLNLKNKNEKMLHKLLGLKPTLDVVVQMGKNPEKEMRMFTALNTSIQGHPFKVELGAMIESGSMGLFMSGELTVKIQKHPQTFDVTTLFVPNGAFISANMSGETGVKFGSFSLSDLALEIGVSAEGLPSFGIAATIDTKAFESSVAIFFDAAEPQKSLVAGSLSDLNMKEVVDSLVGRKKATPIDKVLSKISISGTHKFNIAGSLAKDLNALKLDKVVKAFKSQGNIKLASNSHDLHLVTAVKGKSWYITDTTTMRHYQLRKHGKNVQVSIEAQFYCAPVDTYIGTKQFKQGFYLNGKINVIGFHAAATINVSTNQGIAVDARADKIVIGSPHLFSLMAAKGKGGAQVSISTYKQPKQHNKLFRNPHFYINGKLEVLGISDAIFITISEHGAVFDLKGSLAPGVHVDLNGNFASVNHLEIDGDLKVGVGSINLGALGKIKIKTDVEASVDISYDGRKITATCKASFEALGQKHRIGRFHLDVKSKALKNIAKTIEKEMEKVLTGALKDVEKWAKAIDKGLVTGVKDTEHVMKTVFKKSDKEIKKIGKDIGHDTEKAAKDVAKGTKKAAKSVAKDSKKAAKTVAKGAKKATKSVRKFFHI